MIVMLLSDSLYMLFFLRNVKWLVLLVSVSVLDVRKFLLLL